MKTLNLLPKPSKKELELEFISKRVLAFWVMAIASLLIFVGVAALFRFYMANVVASKEQMIAANKKQLESDENKALHDEIINLNGMVAEIKNINRHHYVWSESLFELSNLVSPNVQFNQLVFEADTGKIDVSGKARARADVLGLWSNITNSTNFQKINFPLTNLEKPTDADFTFTFFVKKEKFIKPQ